MNSRRQSIIQSDLIGIVNFRDVASIVNARSERIARLDEATLSDRLFLTQSCGIKTVIDLRSRMEQTRSRESRPRLIKRPGTRSSEVEDPADLDDSTRTSRSTRAVPVDSTCNGPAPLGPATAPGDRAAGPRRASTTSLSHFRQSSIERTASRSLERRVSRAAERAAARSRSRQPRTSRSQSRTSRGRTREVELRGGEEDVRASSASRPGSRSRPDSRSRPASRSASRRRGLGLHRLRGAGSMMPGSFPGSASDLDLDLDVSLDADLDVDADIDPHEEDAEGPLHIPGLKYHDINLNGFTYTTSLMRRLDIYQATRLILLMTLGYKIPAMTILASQVISRRGLDGLAIDSLLFSRAQIVNVLSILVDEKAYPCLVHCTQGKDRTGLVVLIVLMVLGCEMEVIEEEYLASQDGLARSREERVAEIRTIGLPDQFADCGPRWTRVVVGYIQDECGGIEKYLEGCGFTRQMQSKLRAVLLQREKGPDVNDSLHDE